MRLDYEPNEALTQIAAQVNKIHSELAENARDPVISLKMGRNMRRDVSVVLLRDIG
ncbi:hypothetical protein [Alishewanella longhuensis]